MVKTGKTIIHGVNNNHISLLRNSIVCYRNIKIEFEYFAYVFLTLNLIGFFLLYLPLLTL